MDECAEHHVASAASKEGMNKEGNRERNRERKKEETMTVSAQENNADYL